MSNRISTKRLLFVWDGMDGSVNTADHVVDAIEGMHASCIHVLPHEAISAYGTLGHCQSRPVAYEESLYTKFNSATSTSQHLTESKLELVFGERIHEIVRYSRVLRATLILMPKFQQSRFSFWLHGDLNRRIGEMVSTPIVFYDPNSKALLAKLPPSK